ncbi:MAG: hypothetical protein KGL39_49600 [Patescibacteria group bacterium]|nr:hypothetical protein [Patescibacteria group bacterium]
MSNGTTTPIPDFGTYLMTSLMADISADVYPDAKAVLDIVVANGFQALLDPKNGLVVQSFLVKLQADALQVGNDLSKQIATYLELILAAKFNAKMMRGQK